VNVKRKATHHASRKSTHLLELKQLV